MCDPDPNYLLSDYQAGGVEECEPHSFFIMKFVHFLLDLIIGGLWGGEGARWGWGVGRNLTSRFGPGAEAGSSELSRTRSQRLTIHSLTLFVFSLCC